MAATSSLWAELNKVWPDNSAVYQRFGTPVAVHRKTDICNAQDRALLERRCQVRYFARSADADWTERQDDIKIKSIRRDASEAYLIQHCDGRFLSRSLRAVLNGQSGLRSAFARKFACSCYYEHGHVRAGSSIFGRKCRCNNSN